MREILGAATGGDDLVLQALLRFLLRDMQRHPERLQALDPAFADELKSLTRDVIVDVDQPLSRQVD